MVETWVVNSAIYISAALIPAAKGYWTAWWKDKEPWDWTKFGVSMVTPILFGLCALGALDIASWSTWQAFSLGLAFKVGQEFAPMGKKKK